MAGSGTDLAESSSKTIDPASVRLKSLYPTVDENETPLPRQWSTKDKFTYIGLSQNNLRVHYKGNGKTHKDAASVRTTHPIPVTCGIYYFEVKIISKGRDGYMGIGLTVQGVNLNRLPGWDKSTYGYHGDDGNSFCSSGGGHPYGPTFTTGDIIGCCLNFVDNTCFYTKNGVNLGIAFKDLPPDLYPTVGLQTPGEVVEANFGQLPFVFDIEDYIQDYRRKTSNSISTMLVPYTDGEWQTLLQKTVSTYLVHYGYCATAEAFCRAAGLPVDEELLSIKNRQKIQHLVLTGCIGEAIETTNSLYPGLLGQHPSLLFVLKVRQFIEMINGCDTSLLRATASPKPHIGSSWANSPVNSPNGTSGCRGDTTHIISVSQSQCASPKPVVDPHLSISSVEHLNSVNTSLNRAVTNGTSHLDGEDLTDMDIDTSQGDREVETRHVRNVVANGCGDGVSEDEPVIAERHQEDMDTSESSRRLLCGGSPAALERMLQFGRELNVMVEKLRGDTATYDSLKKTLKDAFSLLAYADPWSSPVGYQLDPVQREPVGAALNSAILESQDLPSQPPLEIALGQAAQCLRQMGRAGIGTCAFVSIPNYL